jgi:hypothetical protein
LLWYIFSSLQPPVVAFQAGRQRTSAFNQVAALEDFGDDGNRCPRFHCDEILLFDCTRECGRTPEDLYESCCAASSKRAAAAAAHFFTLASS